MADTTTPSEFVFVEIDSIIIQDRSREIDPVWVDALAMMFVTGEMLNPVTLWRGEDGPQLVAGAHRIAAQKKNGETRIAAKWSNAKTYADAKILEITENVGRRELNALDRAQHLFDLKEAYEAKFPETKAGVAGAMAKHGSANEIISFASDAAETLGISDRAIQLAVKMWTGLSDATKTTVRGTWLADHQAGLISLSREKPKTQEKALKMLFPGEGKQPKAANVPDALYILENGRLLSSVEKKFDGLNKTLKGLADEELDAVLIANEERIMEWVDRRLGGSK